jgi:flagellar secretion chaperone FliS
MSARSAALATYAQSSAATASPHEVVRMAYDRVITSCDRAELAERERGQNWLQVFHDETIRAQLILLELSAGLALNHPSPDVVALSNQFDCLYEYAIQELVRANTQKSADPIPVVRMVVDGLRSAWVVVAQ